MPGGIAIPHAKSDAVTQPTLAAARLPEGVDFGSFDGPADLVFLIAVPTASTQDHLAVLSTLARSLRPVWRVRMSTRPGRSSISMTTLASSLLAPRVRFTASSVTSSPEPADRMISPEMFDSVRRPFAPILNCREIH